MEAAKFEIVLLDRRISNYVVVELCAFSCYHCLLHSIHFWQHPSFVFLLQQNIWQHPSICFLSSLVTASVNILFTPTKLFMFYSVVLKSEMLKLFNFTPNHHQRAMLKFLPLCDDLKDCIGFQKTF